MDDKKIIEKIEELSGRIKFYEIFIMERNLYGEFTEWLNEKLVYNGGEDGERRKD